MRIYRYKALIVVYPSNNDAVIGRFISADTVVQSFSNPQCFNKYSYCFNNPLKYNDPTGHWPNWHIIGQFFCGIGDAFVSTAKGVTQMITNPVETAKAIGYAVTHPVETIKAIASDYGEKASSVRGWGEIVGEVLITVATIEASSFIKGSGKVAEVANLLKGEVGSIGKAKELGQIGQELAGIVKNTKRIDSITGTAKYRVPDGLDKVRGIISEVKNVKYQSLTNQIKDYLLYSRREEFIFELWTKPNTRFSSPLQKLIDSGQIIQKVFE